MGPKFSIKVLATTFEYLISVMLREFSSGPRMRVGPKQMPRFDTVIRFF